MYASVSAVTTFVAPGPEVTSTTPGFRKPGVVLVTSGPGATNVVTALTDAYMDSVPLVCISGQVPTHLIGTDAFQECDTTGITRPCTKHNWLVKDINDLPRIMHEAFEVATTGRPGPVLVDIPKDIQFAKAKYFKPRFKIFCFCKLNIFWDIN